MNRLLRSACLLILAPPLAAIGACGESPSTAPATIDGGSRTPGPSSDDRTCGREYVGGCSEVCIANVQCYLTCPEGGCDDACLANSKCEVDCGGAGGCKLNCENGADCKMNCPAGNCTCSGCKPPRQVPGTRLVDGVTIGTAVIGVTDDGYVAFKASSRLGVIDARTQTQTTLFDGIHDVGSAVPVFVQGHTVFGWSQVNEQYGTLNVWTAATGLAVGPDRQSVLGMFAMSDDGARLASLQGVGVSTSCCSSALLTGPTLTPSIATVSNVSLRDIELRFTCPTILRFGGRRFFLGACENDVAPMTVRAFGADGEALAVIPDAEGGAHAPILANDQDGSHLLVVSSGGAAVLHTFPGDAATPIDTGVTSAIMTPEGTAIVYTTTAGDLKRVSTTAPIAPVVLATGFRGIISASADAKHAIVTPVAPRIGYTNDPFIATFTKTDRYLADLSAPGAPTLLAANALGIYQAFTRSGRHVLYVNADESGIARARPTAGGEEVTLGAIDAILEPYGSNDLVVVEKHVVNNHVLRAVKVGNLDQGWAPKLVVDDVDGPIAVYNGKLYFNVSVTSTDEGAGIYVMDMPQ